MTIARVVIVCMLLAMIALGSAVTGAAQAMKPEML